MPPEPPSTPRKRGGQPGNRNRLKHGAWSKAAAERRKAVKALVRRMDNLIVRARMMANAERALHRKRVQTLKTTAPVTRQPQHLVPDCRAAGARRFVQPHFRTPLRARAPPRDSGPTGKPLCSLR